MPMRGIWILGVGQSLTWRADGTDGRRNEWTEERMDGGMYGQMENGRRNGWTDGGTDGRTEERMDERRNGWTDGGWTEELMDGGTD